MRCCNHNCNQRRDCPTRQACELPDKGSLPWVEMLTDVAITLVVFFITVLVGLNVGYWLHA